ncbi:hypothetical protein CLOL250_01667 [Clostridium sp. L2-50]|nr:hypothetical protein CLOL250_01667 [Clostridium sp. L2-50]
MLLIKCKDLFRIYRSDIEIMKLVDNLIGGYPLVADIKI